MTQGCGKSGEGSRGQRFADRSLLGSQSILRPVLGQVAPRLNARGWGRGIPRFSAASPSDGHRGAADSRGGAGAGGSRPASSAALAAGGSASRGGAGRCPPSGLSQRPKSLRGGEDVFSAAEYTAGEVGADCKQSR